jgi:DNA-nicking Smr family endonuclease
VARRLDGDEKLLWNKVVATITPLHPASKSRQPLCAEPNPNVKDPPIGKTPIPRTTGKTSAPIPKIDTSFNRLDGSWDRKIGKGAIVPDVSIDLHGQGLSSAYVRLDGALEQAITQGMRVILLVTGKARAHDRMSGNGRGAIASVVHDWLAASRHSAAISAVRNAHPRHGGAGALYIILKR